MDATKHFLLDKTGREILPGDTLKVFHFIAARRRERCYMHKWVESVVELGEGKTPFLRLSHLSLKRDSHYHERLDGRKLNDVEIVQGYGGDEVCWRDRPCRQPITQANPPCWALSGQPL